MSASTSGSGVGLRGSGEHVAQELGVPGRVDEHNVALGCAQPDLAGVDGDALVALGLQRIEQKRPLERHAAARAHRLEGLELSVGQAARLVQQRLLLQCTRGRFASKSNIAEGVWPSAGRPGGMPVIPGSFDYHRPKSLREAVALLADLGEEARPLAGGHSLIPMMKLRLATPDHLVDLADIGDLKGIGADGGDIVIGAMTTQHEIVASDLLAAKLPILREA